MNETTTLVAGAANLSADETELLATFRSMSDGYRKNAIIVMQSIARTFPRQRPTLKLVHACGNMARKGTTP